MLKAIHTCQCEQVPEPDGFKVYSCMKCKKFFLLKPEEAYKQELGHIHCPYCNDENHLSYYLMRVHKLASSKYYQEPINDEITLEKEMQEDIKEALKEIIEDIKSNGIKQDEIDKIEFTIDDICGEIPFNSIEMLCCDREIKYENNDHKDIYCPYCGIENKIYE